jgi:hypothetical protein
MITVKLWRFSLPDFEYCPVSGERAVLYLFSLRADEAYLREQFHHQDSGDMPAELQIRLAKEGKIEKITSLDQVPLPTQPRAPLYANGERDWYPYTSWELEMNGFELTVQEFLSPAINEFFETGKKSQ